MVRVVLLDPADNVATLVGAGRKGDTVELVTLLNDIPSGHKVALRAIGRGEQVIKYGAPIGIATSDIAPGTHVHIHNVESARGKGRGTE